MRIKIEPAKVVESWSPDFVEGAVYLVEATSFEQLVHWERWHKKVEWKSHGAGKMPTIGLLNGMPIVLCFFYAHLNGHKVVFWEATSQVIDHREIDDFLKANFPGVPRVDSMNFAHVLAKVKTPTT